MNAELSTRAPTVPYLLPLCLVKILATLLAPFTVILFDPLLLTTRCQEFGLKLLVPFSIIILVLMFLLDENLGSDTYGPRCLGSFLSSESWSVLLDRAFIDNDDNGLSTINMTKVIMDIEPKIKVLYISIYCLLCVLSLSSSKTI